MNQSNIENLKIFLELKKLVGEIYSLCGMEIKSYPMYLHDSFLDKLNKIEINDVYYVFCRPSFIKLKDVITWNKYAHNLCQVDKIREAIKNKEKDSGYFIGHEDELSGM